jgi:hypothetical protein
MVVNPSVPENRMIQPARQNPQHVIMPREPPPPDSWFKEYVCYLPAPRKRATPPGIQQKSYVILKLELLQPDS